MGQGVGIVLPHESSSKGAIENRINDGVDDGGGVAQPQSALDKVSRYTAVRPRAYGEHDIQQEKWRPAEDEREEDQAQHLAGLLLRSHGVRHRRHVLSFIPARQKSGKPQEANVNGGGGWYQKKKKVMLQRVNI